MGWQTTGDVAEFLAAAGGFLRGERARNTILLSVTDAIRADRGRRGARTGGDPARLPLFGWWMSDEVAGAFVHTPPFPVVLSPAPAEAVAELAAKTLADRPLTGINAYEEAATAFGAAWRENTGCRVEVHRRMRLYRLAELAWPDPMPPGAPRVAGESDVALLTDWFNAFAREVDDLDTSDRAAVVREKLGYGGITLWVDGGRRVCMAGLTRQVAGMVRVGPVFTPPELRGHGYASAVTAEVSRAALAAGVGEVLLYADLANPVSNSVYQRIGYRPVEDRLLLSFSAG